MIPVAKRYTKKFWDTANYSGTRRLHDERIAEVDGQFFEAEIRQDRHRWHGVGSTPAVGAKQSRRGCGSA
jgi:hypothetical protein